MTSNPRPGTRILGSLRSADGKGVVRIEDRYDTDIDDLWSAITDPGRLARWFGQVEGDLRTGGEFRLSVEASGVDSRGRVEACEPPRRRAYRSKSRRNTALAICDTTSAGASRGSDAANCRTVDSRCLMQLSLLARNGSGDDEMQQVGRRGPVHWRC